MLKTKMMSDILVPKAGVLSLLAEVSTSGFIKVITQKLNFQMNFFETFPECSLPSTVSKNTIKMMSLFSFKRCDGPILPHLCLYSC